MSAIVVVAARDIGFSIGIDVNETDAAFPGRVIVVGRVAGAGPVVGGGSSDLCAVDKTACGACAVLEYMTETSLMPLPLVSAMA